MADTEPAQVYESGIRRSSRTRARTAKAVGANDSDEASDRSDRNPNETEDDDSMDDDLEVARPKAKRKRIPAGPSAAALRVDLPLIEIIKGHAKLIPRAVKYWVERYEENPKPAIIELLLMLFEACGAKYNSHEESLDDADVDDVVVALVNLARLGEVEDYLSSKKKEVKNFKENLISFWDNLVPECQNRPLFDHILFDKCMDYIIALSCTPPRIYRQMASLMGLQLVTSLINVAKIYGAQRETTQRQLNAEKKKAIDGPRVESLEKRLSDTHEKITVIEEMMRKIFTGLFVHRYRDIDPEIRTACIQSLGLWILSYPSLFLQDLYLKYLGWTLNDTNTGVRKASVLALQNLYEIDDNVPSLGLFTERFANRMIELADDVDISVAVCAIGLLKQLLRHQLIQDDDLGSLYDLLIDDPPEIRRAIGALVFEHLIAQKFNGSQTHSGGDDTEPSEVHLGRMLQILREFSTDRILSTYVIDDVWEYMDAMKDWKCIISILVEENHPMVKLTDEDATNLIWLLSSSVKKAVGEKIVPASDNRKPYQSKAQREMIETYRRDITTSMMNQYPKLLRKFGTDKANITPLVEIIVHLNLELYSLKRQEKNFKTMLQLVKEAILKHGEKNALRSCVKAIDFCSSESRGELHDFAQSKLKELENELIVKLRSAIKEVEDGDDEYSLLVNLKRLYELQLAQFVPIESLYEDMAATLQNFRNMDQEVVSFMLLNMYMHVTWCLHSIVNDETATEASVSSLLVKRATLFDHLQYYLDNPPDIQDAKYGNELASWVCTILVELWVTFRKTSFAPTNMDVLGYCPDESILKKFWSLCQGKLNTADETEDDDDKKEYAEETSRYALMIAAAKLISAGAVPDEYLCPEIISHFVIHGSTIAEIVKYFMSGLKKKEADLTEIFLEALKRAYQRHMAVQASNNENLAGKLFHECKELAARLSGTFTGTGRNKHRSDVLKIVNGGIEYAFVDAPKQLSFLDGAVSHFVSKLSSPDVLDILKDVQRRTANVNTEVDPSGWRPYHIFIDSLNEKCAKYEGLQDKREGTSVRRRGRPRKKQTMQGKKLFDEHSSDGEDISASDQEEEAEDDEVEVPLIHTFKSAAKLRSLRRDGNKGPDTAVTENASVSGTSGL